MCSGTVGNIMAQFDKKSKNTLVKMKKRNIKGSRNI